MRKGKWQAVGMKVRRIEDAVGGGIHTGLPPAALPDGMASAMENVHSRMFPQLASRLPHRKNVLPPLPEGTLRFFGLSFGQEFAAVVGRNLYVLRGGAWVCFSNMFTATEGRVYAADFMDYTVFADGSECKKFNGTAVSAVGTNGTPENAAYLTTHAWHLFTASPQDNYFRYCAVENINDWSAPGDAGQELAETTKGAHGSAITTFQNHVIYFKKNAMFELYGTDSVNFSLILLSGDIGCVAQESIAEIGGKLYFMGNDGVYCYGGGTLPGKICFPIRAYVENWDKTRMPCGGSDGERYYLSLPQKGGGAQTLAYDTRIKAWYAEDAADIFAFVAHEGILYAMRADKSVDAFGGTGGTAEAPVAWHRISKPYTVQNSMRQNWHRLYLRVRLGVGATVTVSLSPSEEGDDFTAVATAATSGLLCADIPPQLRGAAQMRVKLSGTGDAVVQSLEMELRAKERSYLGGS